MLTMLMFYIPRFGSLGIFLTQAAKLHSHLSYFTKALTILLDSGIIAQRPLKINK